MKQNLSLELLLKRVEQVKLLNGERYAEISELSKELGVRRTTLLDFLDSLDDDLYVLANLTFPRKKKSLLVIKDVFLHAHENVRSEKYRPWKLKQNAKRLNLSFYNNYGHVHGVYIVPDYHEDEYCNTLEKIQDIASKYELKSAGYYLGGLGDSTFLKPENGYEITPKVYDELVKGGWDLVGDISKVDDKEWKSKGLS